MKKIYLLLKLLRPYQWVKNGFVFVGLLFGHAWRDENIVLKVLLAAGAFCLVSSAVYIFNDFIDRHHDSAHPTKKNRGLASGEVSVFSALSLAIIVLLAGFVLALLIPSAAVAGGLGSHLQWNIVATMLFIYASLNLAYSLGLKHVVILDVFIIATGFMLRILAGTLGVGIPPSQWLLLCSLMFTLFLGFAKRRSELLIDDQGAYRKVLSEYSPGLLDHMIAVTAAGVIVSYSLYTVSEDTIVIHQTRLLIITVPFVIYGLFRYIYRLHQHGGGYDAAIELFKDPHILLAFLGWLWVVVGLIY